MFSMYESHKYQYGAKDTEHKVYINNGICVHRKIMQSWKEGNFATC
jgi:hypothetical protein